MYLPLLADDGNGVLQFNVMEKALQENVSHSYQVVVLLCLIEGITWFTVSFVMLETRTKWKINKYIYIFKFPFQFLGSHRLLSSFLPVPVMVPHVHQLVLQLLDCPHLSPFTFPPHLDGWLAHYHSTLEKKKNHKIRQWFCLDGCVHYTGLTTCTCLLYNICFITEKFYPQEKGLWLSPGLQHHKTYDDDNQSDVAILLAAQGSDLVVGTEIGCGNLKSDLIVGQFVHLFRQKVGFSHQGVGFDDLLPEPRKTLTKKHITVSHTHTHTEQNKKNRGIIHSFR